MIQLGLLFGAISAATLLCILAGLTHERGYQQGKELGYSKGYEDGRAEEANWWLGVEEVIERTRQKNWKREAER